MTWGASSSGSSRDIFLGCGFWGKTSIPNCTSGELICKWVWSVATWLQLSFGGFMKLRSFSFTFFFQHFYNRFIFYIFPISLQHFWYDFLTFSSIFPYELPPIKRFLCFFVTGDVGPCDRSQCLCDIDHGLWDFLLAVQRRSYGRSFCICFISTSLWHINLSPVGLSSR